MELSKAIDLIRPGIKHLHDAIWADLGCGDGLFTKALADVIGKGSTIYAIDSNTRVFEKMRAIPHTRLKKIVANFERDELSLTGLDGILMANSLHFVKDKVSFIEKAKSWLGRTGYFLIVEYNTNIPNRWVPYPISFESAVKLFSGLGCNVEKTGEQDSVYNRAGMYGARISIV
jgi:ubiquinone/menaquinone biosynthesis C-methylase UbiE